MSGKERLHTLLLWGIAEDLSQPEQHDAMVLFSATEMGSKDEAVASLNNEYRQHLEKRWCRYSSKANEPAN